MGCVLHWLTTLRADNYVSNDLTLNMRYGVTEFAKFCYVFINFVRPTTDWMFEVRNPIEARYFLFSRPGQTGPADQLASYTMDIMSRVARAWL